MAIATSTLHPHLEVLLHRYRRRSAFIHLNLYDPLIEHLQMITAPVDPEIAAKASAADERAELQSALDALPAKPYVPLKSMVAYRVERKRPPS